MQRPCDRPRFIFGRVHAFWGDTGARRFPKQLPRLTLLARQWTRCADRTRDYPERIRVDFGEAKQMRGSLTPPDFSHYRTVTDMLRVEVILTRLLAYGVSLSTGPEWGRL